MIIIIFSFYDLSHKKDGFLTKKNFLTRKKTFLSINQNKIFLLYHDLKPKKEIFLIYK